MKPGLSIGTVGTLQRIVDLTQTITLAGPQPVTVYSTPSMIHMMEHAAREALLPYLDDGEESVGVDVQVKHLAASPLGAEVRAEARVVAIDANQVDFEVQAYDEKGTIGKGTHRRAVVKTERLAAGLARRVPNTSPEHIGTLATLDVEVHGPVASVTLNRPEKRNAINIAMLSELETLAAWLHGQETIRVVHVRGAGPVFSAGDDISELSGDLDACREQSLRRGRLYQRWGLLPQVLVAELRGPALGGGCILACACDFRLGSFNARLGLPEVTLGWPPNYGLQRIMDLAGGALAAELALTGTTLTARQALARGLLTEAVSEFQLDQRVATLIERLLAAPAAAIAETKRLLATNSQSTMMDHHATEAFVRCLQTADAKRSIASFSKSGKK